MKQYEIHEDIRVPKLPVGMSRQLNKKIDVIYSFNHNNSTAIHQWLKYIEDLKDYISNPVIAFDYVNRYAHYPNGAIHLVELNYDVSFVTKVNSTNGQTYVYIFDINFKLEEFGLKAPYKITENEQYNTMNNTRERIRLTESQLHSIIKESVKQVLSEVNWKTKYNALKKSVHNLNKDGFNLGEIYLIRKALNKIDWLKTQNLKKGGYYEDELNKAVDFVNKYKIHGKFPRSIRQALAFSQGVDDDLDVINKNAPRAKDVPTYGCSEYADSVPAYDYYLNIMNKKPSIGNLLDISVGNSDINNYIEGNYDYEKGGRGWHLKDDIDESIHRAIRRVFR